MVVGFEEFTYELTTEEKRMLEKVKSLFTTYPYVGEKRAITNQRLQAYLRHEGFSKVSPVRIRKIVHEARVKSIIPCLASSQKGYFIAQSKEELQRTICSLRQKARSMYEAAQALEYQSHQYFD